MKNAEKEIGQMLSQRLGYLIEFGQVASFTVKQLAPYGITVDEIARVIERTLGVEFTAAERELMPGMGVLSLAHLLEERARGRAAEAEAAKHDGELVGTVPVA